MSDRQEQDRLGRHLVINVGTLASDRAAGKDTGQLVESIKRIARDWRDLGRTLSGPASWFLKPLEREKAAELLGVDLAEAWDCLVRLERWELLSKDSARAPLYGELKQFVEQQGLEQFLQIDP